MEKPTRVGIALIISGIFSIIVNSYAPMGNGALGLAAIVVGILSLLFGLARHRGRSVAGAERDIEREQRRERRNLASERAEEKDIENEAEEAKHLAEKIEGEVGEEEKMDRSIEEEIRKLEKEATVDQVRHIRDMISIEMNANARVKNELSEKLKPLLDKELSEVRDVKRKVDHNVNDLKDIKDNEGDKLTPAERQDIHNELHDEKDEEDRTRYVMNDTKKSYHMYKRAIVAYDNIEKICRKQLALLDSIRPGSSMNVSDVVRKMLQMEHEKREEENRAYEDMQRIHDEMSDVVSQSRKIELDMSHQTRDESKARTDEKRSGNTFR